MILLCQEMREWILSSVTVLLIAGVLSAAIYASVRWHSTESLKNEVRPTFEEFRRAVHSGETELAYGLMTQAFRDANNLRQFGDDFSEILPLKGNWTVLREREGRYRICCAHPGASFSPSSTMTYVVEREGADLRFTGEQQMWMD